MCVRGEVCGELHINIALKPHIHITIAWIDALGSIYMLISINLASLNLH